MTSNSDANPYLLFFQHQPQNLAEKPPLASSIQTFETSLLLISIGRYPHALVSCVSAIESAIKADQGYPKKPHYYEEHKNLEELLNICNQKLNADREAKALIRDARRLRNDIAHWGFSPKDDATCADLLLRIGYPYLFACYDQFFQLALLKEPEHKNKSHSDDGLLLPEISEHFKIALRVFERVKDIKNKDRSYCFLGLAHQIKIIIQPSFLSYWQWEVLESEEEGMQPFEIKAKVKEKYQRKYSHPWDHFDCPICGYDDLVCNLKFDDHDSEYIGISEGVCVNCNFEVSSDCTYLLDELMSKQLIQYKDEINKKYPFV